MTPTNFVMFLNPYEYAPYAAGYENLVCRIRGFDNKVSETRASPPEEAGGTVLLLSPGETREPSEGTEKVYLLKKKKAITYYT